MTMHSRHEMLELVVVDGRARGIVARDLVTGEIESHVADAVVLATGGYGTVFYLATYAKGCNTTAIWRAYKKGAAFGNPCYTQIHPTCIPVTGEHQSKLTLMSESLRNDGRIWVPKQKGDRRPPGQIPEDERDYYLERKYPSYGNLAPRDISSRAAKEVCDEGRGVGKTGLGVYLDFSDAINRLGVDTIRERYGNLFDMYERITDEDPYRVPMRIYPATHYTMGGLWVDYNLMSTIPGLFVLGEANFSDHGANRLGASALMQGLADGYFIVPYTVGNYLASTKLDKVVGRPLRLQGGRGLGGRPAQDAPGHPGPADGRHLPPRARQDHVGLLRDGPERTRAQDGPGEDPGPPRGVLAGRPRPGRRRGGQPVAREGRPRRRLPRTGRADVPRRAGAARVVWRPLPRGVPDRRTARPCATTSTSATSRPGSTRARASGRSATSSRSPSRTSRLQTRSYK